MQAIIVLVAFLSYTLLLFQYRQATKSGARDIATALSEKFSLQLLNKRNAITTAFMFLSLALCWSTNQNIFLQHLWNEKFVSAIILLSGLCFFLSVYSGFRMRDQLVRTVSVQESIGYLSLRIPGLIVYEIFFRVVLLGMFIHWLPVPLAIAFNTILYALAHAFSSRKEFAGSIPFGLLLCYITINSQSILPAVVLHLCLALPYECILLKQSQLLTKKIRL